MARKTLHVHHAYGGDDILINVEHISHITHVGNTEPARTMIHLDGIFPQEKTYPVSEDMDTILDMTDETFIRLKSVHEMGSNSSMDVLLPLRKIQCVKNDGNTVYVSTPSKTFVIEDGQLPLSYAEKLMEQYL
jgi:hypothetical protein